MRHTLAVLIVLVSCGSPPCDGLCSKSQFCSQTTNTCVLAEVLDAGVGRSDAGSTSADDAGPVAASDSGIVVFDGGVKTVDAGTRFDAGLPLGVGDDVGAGRFKVLFDNTKAEQASNADWVIDDSGATPSPANPSLETDWKGGYSAWGVALAKTGKFDLQTLTLPRTITFGDASNPLDLKHFHAFVIPEPNTSFTASEMTALVEYVKAGGGLFLIGDHINSDRNNDGVDSVAAINQFATAKGNPFGITLTGDNLFQAPITSVITDPASPILHGPFGEVTKATYFNGSTLVIDPVANPTVRALFWKNKVTGGNSNVVLATSTLGKGRVAVFGDSSAADDGTGNGGSLQDGWHDPLGDNAALFPNVTQWLATQH